MLLTMVYQYLYICELSKHSSSTNRWSFMNGLLQPHKQCNKAVFFFIITLWWHAEQVKYFLWRWEDAVPAARSLQLWKTKEPSSEVNPGVPAPSSSSWWRRAHPYQESRCPCSWEPHESHLGKHRATWGPCVPGWTWARCLPQLLRKGSASCSWRASSQRQHWAKETLDKTACQKSQLCHTH